MALVTGLSRGSGRTIAVALSSRGAHVAGVAGDPGRLEELHAQPGGTFTPVGASARWGGPPTPEVSQPRMGGALPGVRAQLLATEHWSLLATRSTAQSEVLSRITTFLTLVSASIVSLALIGQFTRFDQRFITFALVLLGMLALTGTLTQMRAGNASIEDLAHVIGMNRLRAAYVELDPGIERYLVTSAHDDANGLWRAYNHLEGPKPVWQMLASSWMFIAFVNSGLTGVLATLAAMAFDAPGPLAGTAAAAGGLSFLGASAAQGILGATSTYGDGTSRCSPHPTPHAPGVAAPPQAPPTVQAWRPAHPAGRCTRAASPSTTAAPPTSAISARLTGPSSLARAPDQRSSQRSPASTISGKASHASITLSILGAELFRPCRDNSLCTGS